MKKFFVLILSFVFLIFLCSCQADDSLDIVTVTDIHFAGREYHDYEGYFAEASDTNGSGKQMKYLDDIFDAFIEEMKERKPDYIIVTGDFTYNGAMESHLAFIEKISPLDALGIKILVLPGNHDICSPTYIFPNGGFEETTTPTTEEFRELYANFGYSDGISYDENSLSYVYDTEKGVRIFMLDTNAMYGFLYGDFSGNKLDWLKKELALCNEAGDIPIVAAHHNLLEHNPKFNFGYKLSNGEELAELISEYGGTLYLSGHMHTQHYTQNEKITDIVGGAFSVYPHRYGIIDFSKDGWTYNSIITDVELYAEKIGTNNPDLIGYNKYGYDFFYNNAYAQALSGLSSAVSDPELLEKYADFTAQLNVAYFGGTFSDVDLSIAEQFLSDCEETGWGNYMKYVLNDTKDSIYCQWPKETE